MASVTNWIAILLWQTVVSIHCGSASAGCMYMFPTHAWLTLTGGPAMPLIVPFGFSSEEANKQANCMQLYKIKVVI